MFLPSAHNVLHQSSHGLSDYLPGLGNSDHVCIRFHLLCYSTFKPNQTPRYNLNRAVFDNMREALYTINWLDIMEPMDTQESWEFFNTVFQDIIDNMYQ